MGILWQVWIWSSRLYMEEMEHFLISLTPKSRKAFCMKLCSLQDTGHLSLFQMPECRTLKNSRKVMQGMMDQCMLCLTIH